MLVAAAFFVSSRKIQVSLQRGKASVASASNTIISGAVVAPNGSKEIINPKMVNGTFTDIKNKFYQDPTQFLNPDQKARIQPQLNQYIAVPKTTTVTPAQDMSRLAVLKVRDLKQVDYPKAQSLSFKLEKNQSLQEVQAALPDSNIIQDHIAYVKQVADTSPDLSSGTTTTAAMAAAAKPVTVGVVDTGVDGVDGANYAPGPEITRFLTFFEPWQSVHSFPIQVPASAGWLNVAISWNYFFGFIQSPSDLDLVVKNQNGTVVGQSNNTGSVPASERVEVLLPPRAGNKIYTAEISVKNTSPRILWEDFQLWGIKFPHPAFTVQLEASLDPQTLNIALDSSVISLRPKGALDSYNKKWKKGVISLNGKKYNIVASDVYHEQVCAQSSDPNSDFTFKQYIYYGYDGVSIDVNGDGNYSDLTVVGTCQNGFYDAPPITLDGGFYSLNLYYSTYNIEAGTFNGQYRKQTEAFLTGSNDKVIGFERYFGFNVYGPKDTTQDFLGHGTHVAGIIKAQAPNAKIYNAKVFGNGPAFAFCFASSGSSELDPNAWTLCEQGVGAYESDIINGIEGAVSQGAKVINLSLGGYYTPPYKCSDFLLPQYLKDLINKRGITIVVAAGNEGPGQGIESPGCLSEAITVGAAGATNNNVTNYSSRGPSYEGLDKPDLVAIGGDDPSLNIQKNIGFVFPGGVVSNESSRLWSLFGIADKAGENQIKLSGTSMATPQVAGAAAVLIGTNSALSPIQIKSLLMDSATDLGQPKEAQGAGLLNLSRALSLLKPKISTIKPSSGEVDTKAAILGSGFAKTNTIKFGKGYIVGMPSLDGTSLSFTVPSSVSPCLTGPVGCPQPNILIVPNKYLVSVMNGYITSNQLTFTVVAPKTVLNVSLDKGSPAQTFAPGSTNVEVARFDLSAQNGDVPLSTATFTVVGGNSFCYFKNFMLYNASSGSPVSTLNSLDTSKCEVKFSKISTVVANNTLTVLSLRTDILKTAPGGDKFAVQMSDLTSTDTKVGIQGLPVVANGCSILGNQTAVTVTSPNGGEGWVKGSLNNITWKRNFLPSSSKGLVNIFIRRNNQPNTQVAKNAPDSAFQWMVPESYMAAKDYKITVTSDGFGNNLSDESDNYFQIIPSSSSVSSFLLPENSGITINSAIGSQINYSVSGFQSDTKLRLVGLLLKDGRSIGYIFPQKSIDISGGSSKASWDSKSFNQSGFGFQIRLILYYGVLQVGTSDSSSFIIL